MTLEGSCHCGAVQIAVPRRPRVLVACNCSICRRYGTLWSYYKAKSVRLTAARGALGSYSWGTRRLTFVHCRQCACVLCWQLTRPRADGKMGVNARNLDPALVEGVRIRRLDGAKTWKYLD